VPENISSYSYSLVLIYKFGLFIDCIGNVCDPGPSLADDPVVGDDLMTTLFLFNSSSEPRDRFADPETFYDCYFRSDISQNELG
jgi:hypothetical protein